MAEKISWHPPDAALRPASHFECALRRRRKIGFCPPTARWLRVAMLGLSARPSAAPLSSYRKVPRSGERVQEPTTTLPGQLRGALDDALGVFRQQVAVALERSCRGFHAFGIVGVVAVALAQRGPRVLRDFT